MGGYSLRSGAGPTISRSGIAVAALVLALLVGVALPVAAQSESQPEVRVYLNDPGDGVWILCEDVEGFLIWFGVGEHVVADRYGEWEDIKDQYDLRNGYLAFRQITVSCSILHELFIRNPKVAERLVAGYLEQLRTVHFPD